MYTYIKTKIEEIDLLDEGIKPYVKILLENDVETFESCEGGIGHAFCEPTIRFHGDQNEGLRVVLLCLQNNLPICEIRRCFFIQDKEIQSPYWEVTFSPSIAKENLTLDKESGCFTDSLTLNR